MNATKICEVYKNKTGKDCIECFLMSEIITVNYFDKILPYYSWWINYKLNSGNVAWKKLTKNKKDIIKIYIQTGTFFAILLSSLMKN